MNWFLENYREIKLVESIIGVCISSILLFVLSILPKSRPTKRATDAEDSAASQAVSDADNLSTSDGSAATTRRS